MKRIFIALIFFNSVLSFTFGQNKFPQFWFYNENYQSPQVFNNDAEESDILYTTILSKLLYGTPNQIETLDLLYRIYEIENTSEIQYSTIDNQPLPFQCNNSWGTNSQAVDFGAPLYSNEIDDNYFYRLRFEAPVTTIDPSLFSERVTNITLPQTQHLSYHSSPSIMVKNLSTISGKDVVDNTFLIDRQNTLIVAATHDKISIKIPENVTAIGIGAFRGTGLSSIIIPENISLIENNAFDSANISNYFISTDKILIFKNNAFGHNSDKDFTIYVPQKTINEYQSTYPSLKSKFRPIEKHQGIFTLNLAIIEYEHNNYAKAKELFETTLTYKCHDANYWLGEIYWHGKGITQDKEKAYSYYEKSAKKNHIKSMIMCYEYYKFKNTPSTLKKATKWLKRAVKQGSPEAAILLGNIYSDSEYNGYPLKLQESLNYYKKAIELNANFQKTMFNVSRVNNLITYGANKKITFKPSQKIQFDIHSIDYFLYSSFHSEKETFVFDMARALMKKYGISEEVALKTCNEHLSLWEKENIITSTN